MTFNFQKGCIAVTLCTLFAMGCQEIPYSDGKQVYESQCTSCHGAQGQGLQGLIPPIAGTDWLNTPELRAKVACGIRYGMNGKITVNGREYEGVMQSFPKLSDVDIANVMNYMANNFGNSAPTVHLPEVQQALSNCSK